LKIVRVALQRSVAAWSRDVVNLFRNSNFAERLAEPAQWFAPYLAWPYTFAPFPRLNKAPVGIVCPVAVGVGH